MSIFHDSCHRYVTKHTNPLQVDNLITNKSVAILEDSTRILNKQCVGISVLANVKIFYEHHEAA